MSAIRNQAILASAGSGKTFQLAHRYLRLLAYDVPPDRIVALTFARKAAGEIADSVMRFLREAAEDPEKARVTAQRIGRPDMKPSDFLRMLRGVVDRLHRLHIGTLDGFTLGVVRAFPMELGIGADPAIEADKGEPEGVCAEVLERLFRPPARGEHSLRNAFRMATFGDEQKQIERHFQDRIKEGLTLYQRLPDERAWGERSSIWPDGSMSGKDEDLDAIAAQTAFVGLKLDSRLIKGVNQFLAAALGHDVSRRFDAKPFESRFVLAALEQIANKVSGELEFSYNKKVVCFSVEQSAWVRRLIRSVLRIEVERALEKTRGLHALLAAYEGVYDKEVRRRGRLTFRDAQLLLTPANSACANAALSSRADARLFIDFRLDCRLDHWLLDEFQDTSDIQWDAIRNLADEIMQDATGSRSFFFVGDVKQAIHGWRGGNARLFGRILKKYGPAIEQSPLNESFRSCGVVIEAVNRSFQDLPSAIPDDAREYWQGVWQEHRSAGSVANEPGCVMHVEPILDSDKASQPGMDTARQKLAARLVREIDPIRRGWTMAVLMPSNDDASRMTDMLRSECPEIPISLEGRGNIADNPVVNVLLSLAQLAAHSGDTLALRHVQMSPLCSRFCGAGSGPAAVSGSLLRDIQACGFQAFVRHWGAELGVTDAFGLKRLHDMAEAAAIFDASGSRDVDEFIRFIGGYELRESSSARAVRVMTIHQAKGLGFDVVILPRLQNIGRRPDMTRAYGDALLAGPDPDGPGAQWVLRMPPRVLAEADPVLQALRRASDARACFESLCLLYVAMTRARRGLYVITSATAEAYSHASFLRERLCDQAGSEVEWNGMRARALYMNGDPDWYKTGALRQAAGPAPAPETCGRLADRPGVRRRLARLEPSAGADMEMPAGRLFMAESQKVLCFGSAIHAMLEKVEWSGDADVDAIIREWLLTAQCAGDVKRDAGIQFRNVLQAKEARAALARPETKVELWREKRFEVIIPVGDRQTWVTGIFDRATVLRDAQGRAVSADILDYKSDRIDDDGQLAGAVERHAPQMRIYKQALAQLTGLAPESIVVRILFTRSGRVRAVG